MISYKDRTYCSRSFQNLCLNQYCEDAISPKDRIAAEHCGLDFSVCDFRTDDCGEVVNSIYTHLKEIVGG